MNKITPLILAAAVAGCAARKPLKITWINQIIGTENDDSGKPQAYIVPGLGSDGILYWGRTPYKAPPAEKPAKRAKKKP